MVTSDSPPWGAVVKPTTGGRHSGRQRPLGQRRCLAGDAEDGEGVDPVWGDLELDYGLAEPVSEGEADRSRGVEDHDPLVLVGDAELLLRADHPLRGDAADDAGFERPICGRIGVAVDQAGAGKGEGDLLPGGNVRRAGDDLQPVGAGLDRRQDEAVGVGVALDALDQADEDLVPRGADRFDFLRFESGHGQAMGQFGRR
jgi:hypothetical protein